MLAQIKNWEWRVLEAEMEEYGKDVILWTTGIDLHRMSEKKIEKYKTIVWMKNQTKRRKNETENKVIKIDADCEGSVKKKAILLWEVLPACRKK